MIQEWGGEKTTTSQKYEDPGIQHTISVKFSSQREHSEECVNHVNVIQVVEYKAQLKKRFYFYTYCLFMK